MRSSLRALAITFCLAACGDKVVRVSAPTTYDGCTDCSLIARQIAWSFDHDPNGWSSDGFRAMHGPWLWHDAYVWVANGEFGIGIGDTSDNDSPPLASESDRALIYRAFSRWQTVHMEK